MEGLWAESALDTSDVTDAIYLHPGNPAAFGGIPDPKVEPSLDHKG